jgi:glycosyltransferase involved in cell wall biosynthesis
VRVALVHDWLTGMRGGEKVLVSLARLFPGAPVFTLLHVKGSVDAEIEAREVRTSFAQKLPDLERRYRHYLPLFPAAAASLDLEGFDLVVSSSHCAAKGVRVPEGALHVCYCHTPMRYVWDRFDDYFGPGRVSLPARIAIGIAARYLRAWDVATSAGVDAFVANSGFVAGRIARYYGRSARTIPPPVDTDFFTPGDGSPGAYDLVVSALAPYKRLDLVLEAYRGTGWPLRIVGTGPEEERLRRLAPSEVRFLGRVSDASLRDLYRGCRAVVMASVEDFGIVPLEAMACGRPAVVFGEGGGPESIVEGETGLVFREPTPACLRATVDSLGGLRFNGHALRARSEAFRRPVFEARLRAFVEEVVSAPRGHFRRPIAW